MSTSLLAKWRYKAENQGIHHRTWLSCVTFLFWDSISCSPGWSLISNVVEDVPELFIMPDICTTGNRTQGLLNARLHSFKRVASPALCRSCVCGVFFHYRSISWVTAPLSSPQVFSLLAGWNHHDKSHHERVFGCVFGEHMHSFLLNVYLSVTARSQGWHMLRCSKYCQTVSQIGCNNWLSSSRRWGFQLLPILLPPGIV